MTQSIVRTYLINSRVKHVSISTYTYYHTCNNKAIAYIIEVSMNENVKEYRIYAAMINLRLGSILSVAKDANIKIVIIIKIR